MAFSTGGTEGLSCGINVTPMIDILLVALIIFIAITPVSPTGPKSIVPLPQKAMGRNIRTVRSCSRSSHRY